MKDYSYVYNAHPAFIEKMYRQYSEDPNSVDSGWRTFFEGFEFAGVAPQGALVATSAQSYMYTRHLDNKPCDVSAGEL